MIDWNLNLHLHFGHENCFLGLLRIIDLLRTQNFPIRKEEHQEKKKQEEHQDLIIFLGGK